MAVVPDRRRHGQGDAGLADLERRLAHRFADAALLRQALTHRSAGRPHNERLEFLGDSLLGAAIAERLYRALPDADEGLLTRARARLVNRRALASRARELGLGEHLQLGAGELGSGGWRRDSILADALEAVLAAAYLDGGWEALRTVIDRVFGTVLDELARGGTEKDPKTRLQEWLQARRLPLPEYVTVAETGPPHAPCFTVRCALDGVDVEPVQASGRSRRVAEQAAAQAMLERLDPAHAAQASR